MRRALPCATQAPDQCPIPERGLLFNRLPEKRQVFTKAGVSRNPIGDYWQN